MSVRVICRSHLGASRTCLGSPEIRLLNMKLVRKHSKLSGNMLFLVPRIKS
ncbi:hypothetical protein AAG906_030109 [Vitis piasezkii]